MSQSAAPIKYVDSHTAGEPTRVVIAGAPDLGKGPVSAQLARLRMYDGFRKTVILEPRGWDALVGAVLCESADSQCVAGVIFINNTGYLNMCGHGTIGLAVTLHHLGKIGLGKHLIETPVGIVEIDLLGPNEVAVENVPSYRLQKRREVQVDGLGTVVGDIAWGGNWFFLVEKSLVSLVVDHLRTLTDAAEQIRKALRAQQITGANGAEIDHIEFFESPPNSSANSRNYVYCPGGAFDRSPCGTGTSAKVACLAADGKLQPGEVWVQESIIGSQFRASYRLGNDGRIIPRIVGRAYVCSEGTLWQHPEDPFRTGISFSGDGESPTAACKAAASMTGSPQTTSGNIAEGRHS